MEWLMTGGKKRILLIASMLVALGIGGLAIVHTVYALNQNLPGGLDVEAAGQQNAIELHLKYLDAAQVTDNNMSAYYPGTDSSANGKSISISAGPKGRICNIDSAALNGRVRVTISIQGNSVDYNIPISQVCGTNNFYDREFAFPNGTLIKDPFIDRYRADIRVNYKIQDNEIPASKKSDLNYKMSLTGNNSGNGDLALRKSNAADQFGMRSSWANDSQNAPSNTLRLAIPFGFHCSANVDNAAERQVKLYDADAVFGDTYMWVEKDDVKLPLDAYGSTSRVDRWEESSKRWKLSGSNNDENVLTLKKEYITRGAKYELVMTNPGTNVDGKPSPYSTLRVHMNTLSVGIPQDSIYIQGDCSYKLRPRIDPLADRTYVYYPNHRVDARVVVEEPGPIPEAHPWEVYAVRYAGEPSTRFLTDDSTSSNPCTQVIPSGGSGCIKISDDSLSYSARAEFANQYSSGGPDSVGTRLCFFARIQNPTDAFADDSDWAYSDMECSVSVKKPRVQFLGSDVRVGGNAYSSTYKVQNNNYGSWAEYGMFTTGTNSLVTSGNGLRNGNSNDSVPGWNRLTFANTPSYGGYSPLPAASSAYTYFRNLPPSGTYNQGNPTTGVYDFENGKTIGNLKVTANGQSIIIRSPGTIKINNIEVTNEGVTSASDLSQVVIVAENIVFGNSADRADAWLVTSPTGYINTCDTGTQTLTSVTCPRQLTINGPVYTNRLMLRRTAGANPPTAADLSQPAERFNLRPDAQLWAYTYANKADYAQTDYVQELPPRY